MKKIVSNSVKILAVLAFFVFIFFVYRVFMAISYHNKGLSYYNIGSYKEAIGCFKKSLEIDGSKADVHYALANAYLASGSNDEAIGEFRKALSISPAAYPKAYSFIADIYAKRRDFEGALKVLDEAAAKYPADEDAKQLRQRVAFEYVGDCLARGVDAYLSGDKTVAYDLLKKALDLKPDLVYTHYMLAFFYCIDGQLENAAAQARAALQLDPRFWPAHQVQGDVYLKQKDFNAAVASYRIALEGNPNSAIIKNNLQVAMIGAGLVPAPEQPAPSVAAAPAEVQLPPPPAMDTVYLKNGRSIKGFVRGEDAERVILEVDLGGVRGNVILPQENIERIAKGGSD